MTGFFALNKKLYTKSKHKIHPQGYKILLEIYAMSKPRRVKEIPFIFKDRTQGYSKLGRKVITQYLKMLYELRFRKA